MTVTLTMDEARERFAHCIQVLGGATAASRRLEVDERAIRRFVSGERPRSAGMWQDTAAALRKLVNEAGAAEKEIAGVSAIDQNPS